MLPMLKLQHPRHLFQPKDFKEPFKSKSTAKTIRKSYDRSTTIGATHKNNISID